MKDRRKNMDGSLMRVLAEGWMSAKVEEPGPGWDSGVMRSIRSSSRKPDAERLYNGFSRLVLRVSMAAAAVGALLAAWTLASGISPLHELALAVLEDPASLFVSPPLV